MKIYRIDHIMWEPIFSCKSNCNDCYIAKSPAAQSRLNFNDDILTLLFTDENVECSQFTISLNTLENPHLKLVKTLKWLLNFYLNSNKKEGKEFSLNNKLLPKLCISIQSIKALNKWLDWIELSLDKFLSCIYMLSLSIFPRDQLIQDRISNLCQNYKTILNYNCLVNDSTKIEDLEDIKKYATMIHLIYKKEPLNTKQNREYYTQYLNIYYKIRSSNIYPDQCLVDSVRKIDSGFTCSASISKIHVWPNGAVTGCPYDSFLISNPHNQNINKRVNTLEEIKKLKQKHPMTFCKISDMILQID